MKSQRRNKFPSSWPLRWRGPSSQLKRELRVKAEVIDCYD